MFSTPLIQKIGKGKFVTTQSATEDLTLALGADAKRAFRFSKFALLNLPPVQNSVQGRNTMQPLAVEGAALAGGSTLPSPQGDQTDLSESLQNYFLNLETLLTQQNGYDAASDQSVAERAFFKWLKEIGAIRFRSAVPSTEIAGGAGQGFLEEEPSRDANGTQILYEPVVRYIGEIDVEGITSSAANSFREIILYVPTQNGATPQVLFKSLEDDSYGPGRVIKLNSGVVGNTVEYISGRDADDDPSGAGLRVTAAYDMDVTNKAFDYEVDGQPGGDPWYGQLALAGPNCYFTEPQFGIASTEKIRRTQVSNGQVIEFRRSRLDGIQINFDKSAYPAFVQDPQLSGFNEWNGGITASQSFEFNAVLVYYDLYDPHNPLSAPVTNLYGVLFLDDLQAVSSGAAQINTLAKLRPGVLTGQQGNGYGFRLNFRFDASAYTAVPVVEVSVNDYNTMSMQLFAGALQQLGSASRTLDYATASIRALGARVQDLEHLALNDPSSRIALQAESLIADMRDLLASSGMPNREIQKLVTKQGALIESILRGKTSVEISVLLDLIGKDDLAFELTGKRLTIRNKRQRYPQRQSFLASFGPATPITISLGGADTLGYHDNNGGALVATSDLYIRLNDSQNAWQPGQEVTISFLDSVDFGNGQYGILLYTDAMNAQKASNPYSVLLGVIDATRLVGNHYPTLKVVCLNPSTNKFLVTLS